eukprot:6186623-Pleurochrysis_carterae.AAC.1
MFVPPACPNVIHNLSLPHFHLIIHQLIFSPTRSVTRGPYLRLQDAKNLEESRMDAPCVLHPQRT